MSGPEYDFIIVGAGIAGVAIAYELATDSSVLVLEAEAQPGYHTTGRSAAVFIDSYGNETIQKLSAVSRPFMERPPEGFTNVPLMKIIGGMMILAPDQEASLADLHAGARMMYPAVEAMTADEAVERVPLLARDQVGGALLDPNVGSIDVSALQEGYLQGARRRGVEFEMQRPVSALRPVAGHWEVAVGETVYTARKVVNAAGPWADEVAPMAGARPVGMVPKRRTLVMFDPPEGIEVGDWPIVSDVAENFYFKPESGGIIACPYDTTPSDPCDHMPDELDIATAMDWMERISGREIGTITSKWAGLRTFVRDESPVVGPDPEVPGFFWYAALGGFGIQTVPALARAAAARAREESLPGDILDAGLTEADIGIERLRERA